VKQYGEERLAKLPDAPKDPKGRSDKITELGEAAVNEEGVHPPLGHASDVRRRREGSQMLEAVSLQASAISFVPSL